MAAADAPAPTATEIFNLRSECAALGQKILENNVIGRPLTQSQVSHYEPRTNRCYVELTVEIANAQTPSGMSSTHRYLFDGQTGEMLAAAMIEKAERSGKVYDRTYIQQIGNDAGFANATKYIDDRMADDRTR